MNYTPNFDEVTGLDKKYLHSLAPISIVFGNPFLYNNSEGSNISLIKKYLAQFPIPLYLNYLNSHNYTQKLNNDQKQRVQNLDALVITCNNSIVDISNTLSFNEYGLILLKAYKIITNNYPNYLNYLTKSKINYSTNKL